ncbi:hypothetical protein G6F55_005827 [Rhizopus delemar]|uniref:CSC1/OSCA1-like 7TM region domain-containing protein n=2 Tax=Rhizopus TaxID=4842 RepID=A0A9P6YZG7_9FUNG|nr:hypothetical protein G6F55_005827 [Rhizopus delemar]KAG1548762.1 hypothetical protein G6F51_003472 [Rhizopus arrhizus]KAG1500164.1 hypothetical protein G6F54_003907 [Rhizopus delemar]KAG1502096.1 hypothetical protein G6F53_010935 [Rhizopus delemar]KAG1515130.1 hypothetical protein G6F52_009755 [Rhizopus delemar]
MGIQLGINAATALVTIIGFSILRPKNSLVYAPKLKFSKKEDWPPADGSIDILSLSGINYINGKTRSDLHTVWYWSPFAATYLYSILIAFFMYRASCDYIEMRQHWFRLPENEVSMKSLIVSPVPKEMRSDEKFRSWVESTYHLDYPIKETMIGYQSSKLTELFENHKEAVHRLESTLAAYLSDGKNTETKKRPMVRVGGILCCGGRKVDAIDYYTKQVGELEQEIKALRGGQEGKAKAAPYGWVSFDRIEWAHATERALLKTESHVRLSPTPQDLIWPNLPLDDKTRKAKRWIGRMIYCVFVFAWMIPMSALSATSNLINLIRMIPNSSNFIDNHQILMGVIQSYFTPVIMAIFFYLLPILFRFLSKQQGYWTQTTLDRKVLVKLYIFFIINNLLVFTLTSMFIGIYGHIKAIVENNASDDTSFTDYVMQLAKNISQVSNFWINYVCLHSLGLTMELAMILPLITITLRKFFTRPSPAELRELARPPEFDYPKSYNLLLFFFTVSLLYSAMSPLILPFAFLYFAVASMVYKYLLVYVYETRMESGGKIWPVLFQTIMSSTVLFQCIMILVLAFKGGHLQAYILIPLPFFTLAYQYFYHRRMLALGSYLVGTAITHHSRKSQNTLKSQFQDPAYHEKLLAPTVHEDVKHLLPKVYHNLRHEHHINETIELAHQYSKKMAHGMDLDKKIHRHDVVVVDEGTGFDLKFEAVSEKEMTEPVNEEHGSLRRMDSAEDNSMRRFDSTATSHDYSMRRIDSTGDGYSLGRMDSSDQTLLTRHISAEDRMPLLLAPQPPPRSAKVNSRNVTSEYIELYTSFTPNPSYMDLLVEEQDTFVTRHHPSRRHTLPLPLHDKEKDCHRRLSLPSSIRLEGVQLKRSMSMPVLHLHQNPFDDQVFIEAGIPPKRRHSF